ncbi:SDR family NAD(P)-dependent oxidoreductase [Rhizobium ruizarguesonis]
MSQGIENKVVVITGASSGLGEATARHLAARGACATKFAVRALSEGLRKEVKPYNIRTTIISPGAVSTELLEHISEKDIQAGTKEFVSKIAISADTFARTVAFAVNEPDDVDINEILFRPTAQPV